VNSSVDIQRSTTEGVCAANRVTNLRDGIDVPVQTLRANVAVDQSRVPSTPTAPNATSQSPTASQRDFRVPSHHTIARARKCRSRRGAVALAASFWRVVTCERRRRSLPPDDPSGSRTCRIGREPRGHRRSRSGLGCPRCSQRGVRAALRTRCLECVRDVADEAFDRCSGVAPRRRGIFRCARWTSPAPVPTRVPSRRRSRPTLGLRGHGFRPPEPDRLGAPPAVSFVAERGARWSPLGCVGVLHGNLVR
jgi:hypothetical protein